MKTDNYSAILSIEVSHSFFEKNICDCLSFEPDELTNKVMQRFGFLIRKMNNGIAVYNNRTQSLPVFFDYIKRATFEHSFDFTVKTNDESFWLFTELPEGFDGQIHYSSEKRSIGSDGSVTLDPSYQKGGKGVVGKLRILFDDVLSYKKESEPAVFKIEFKARSTQWQYYIINKSSVHVENPAINSRLNMSFDGPFPVTIPSGEEAMLFTSADKLIPLSEKPSFQLDLVSRKKSESNDERAGPRLSPKMLFRGLPWPDPGMVSLFERNGRSIFSSPMYVYL
jgi:hypothetical protein